MYSTPVYIYLGGDRLCPSDKDQHPQKYEAVCFVSRETVRETWAVLVLIVALNMDLKIHDR